MSIFHPVPKEELGTVYTHYGWFMGIVPVYVGGLEDGQELCTSVRNWCPEFVMDVAEGIHHCLSSLVVVEDSYFSFTITGEIPKC